MKKVVTILVRKAMDYEDLLASQKMMVTKLQTHPEELSINSIVELSHEEFEDFKIDLLAERKFLENRDGIILVKEIGKSDYSGIVVQTSGFSYARYSGLPMRKVDYKKCPRCGEYYVEYPAITRKDNKTEICPRCGTEEAILACGYDFKFISFLDNLHNYANQFNVSITISAPDKDDVVIDPDR